MSTGSNRNTSEYKPLEIPPDTPLPSHRSPAMKQAHIDETSMIVIERLTKVCQNLKGKYVVCGCLFVGVGRLSVRCPEDGG